MWQWRCDGGDDEKRLHYRISRASAARPTFDDDSAVVVCENAVTQFSPVPILHPIQSVHPPLPLPRLQP